MALVFSSPGRLPASPAAVFARSVPCGYRVGAMPGSIPARRAWGALLLVVVCVLTVASVFWWRAAGPAMPTGPVRIGYVHDPPYMFTGQDGRPRGLSVEVVREAARRAGVASGMGPRRPGKGRRFQRC